MVVSEKKFLFKPANKQKNIYKAKTPKYHKNQGSDKAQTEKDSSNPGLFTREGHHQGRRAGTQEDHLWNNAASPS